MSRTVRKVSDHSPRGAIARDSGSVTAEFAVVLPAILIILMIVLAALQVGGRQVRLQSATTDAARLYARGDDSAAARVSAEVAAATVTFVTSGSIACARARAPAGPAILGAMQLAAKSCVLRER